MYNRYIPGSNGVYRRQVVAEPTPPCPPEPPEREPACEEQKQCRSRPPSPAQSGFDLGDLLLLCIVLLLLIDAGQDDLTPLLLAGAVLFIQ